MQPVDNYQEWAISSVVERLLHTPGHTPGSVCFFLPGEDEILLTGDTLFSGGIGRTDLWGGSHRDILRSLDRLMSFRDETDVFPGHGPPTTILKERTSNPFL